MIDNRDLIFKIIVDGPISDSILNSLLSVEYINKKNIYSTNSFNNYFDVDVADCCFLIMSTEIESFLFFIYDIEPDFRYSDSINALNEKGFKNFSENFPAAKIVRVSSESTGIVNAIRAIIEPIYVSNLIGIDYQDIRQFLLSGCNTYAYKLLIDADQRLADNVECENILLNHIEQYGHTISGVLLSFNGSPEALTEEIVMDYFSGIIESAKIADSAPVIIHACNDHSFGKNTVEMLVLFNHQVADTY